MGPSDFGLGTELLDGIDEEDGPFDLQAGIVEGYIMT